MGDLRYVQGRLASDNSWLANGESLTAANLNLDHLYFVGVEEQGGIIFHWNRANNVIQAYRTGTGVNVVLSEVAGLADISAIATSVEFFALGY